MQRFIARESFDWPNGARGWRPGGPFDCLGPFAKVERCPVDGRDGKTVTAYATAYAYTFFSVPACARIDGRYHRGFFMVRDSGPVFVPSRYRTAREEKAARLATGAR